MVYRYNFTVEDHIGSSALKKANARENRGVYHLILFLGLGCVAYLDMAILRDALTWNDPVSYGAGIIVTFVLLIHYSPKLIPSVLVPLQQKRGRLPEGLLGERSFEVTEDRLSFSTATSRLTFGYETLSRVNHNDKLVLFYFQNGTVQAVPLRALGASKGERRAVLQKIQSYAVAADKAGRKPQRIFLSPRNRFTCPVGEEDIIRADRAEQHLRRRRRLKDPFALLALVFLLFCLISAVYGLIHRELLPPALRGYMTAFLILELLAGAVGLVIWYSPSFLSRRLLRQVLRQGRHAPGYIGPRFVSWDEQTLQYGYGSIDMYFPWDKLSSVADEARQLLFFQDGTLVCFLPKEGTPGSFLEAIRKRNQEENHGEER